jgi:NitT/TauT family transport system ATP-binding protein
VTEPKIRIEGLRHTYVDPYTADRVVAMDGVALEVRPGELLAVVGPSGCGKSTLLSIIAGLLRPSAGQVWLDGHAVTGPGRDRGMVFQELGILPWRTVEGNIAHGLEIRKVPKEIRLPAIARFVRLVGLEGFERKYPHELSGGMKQRVAVARALAADPEVLLMDEPFASVDAQTRITLQEDLLQIAEATRKTIVFVTHSVEEAIVLGDRVVVFTARPGRVKEIFDVPVPRKDRTASRIEGDPAMRQLGQAVLASVRAEVRRSDAA